MVPGSAKPSRNKSKKPTIQTSTETAVDQAPHCSPLSWTEPLKRVFDIDISVCRLCGGTLRVIADVTDPETIQTILAHLRQRAPLMLCTGKGRKTISLPLFGYLLVL